MSDSHKAFRPSSHSLKNKLGRALWWGAWCLLYRPTPIFFNPWRRFLLRVFGAKIARGACPRASAKIWAPWNLEMGENSCLGEDVDCYCVGRVSIGARAVVSQYSFLCTASHDYSQHSMPLTIAPVVIEDDVWICADVFLAPGVTVHTGSVVGARSSVFSDVPPWSVMAGSPARFVKTRTWQDSQHQEAR